MAASTDLISTRSLLQKRAQQHLKVRSEEYYRVQALKINDNIFLCCIRMGA